MVFEHLFGAVPSSEQVGGNPWEKASLPSRIAVAWMYPLIELGATVSIYFCLLLELPFYCCLCDSAETA